VTIEDFALRWATVSKASCRMRSRAALSGK
jgi:hypothetical protein